MIVPLIFVLVLIIIGVIMMLCGMDKNDAGLLFSGILLSSIAFAIFIWGLYQLAYTNGVIDNTLQKVSAVRKDDGRDTRWELVPGPKGKQE